MTKQSVKKKDNFMTKQSTKKTEIDNNQLWASRFKKVTDTRSKQYTESITVDRPMFYQNIWGNQAHVIMLANCDIIKDEHCREILKALDEVRDDFTKGKWDLQLQEEDVQMNVERYAIEKSGIENAGRMHTCRSRNDQVPLDTKLHTRDQLIVAIDNLLALIDALLRNAAKHTETLMPGYTHIQHAQPITFAYWLSHYAAVLLRDAKRLFDSYDSNDQNPLGAGAISGTSFPIDRKLTTELLGFQGIHEHGLDAIGSMDSNLELLGDLSILFSTISRIANEIIYNISHEFNTMILDDSFSMGSSMMPQKKNPGVLELVRGRTGRMYGILMEMLTLMKGLHSGYNRDYHEDKETRVEALQLAIDTLAVMEGVLDTLKIKPERLEYLASQNFATATELANYLVRVHNIPFRLCHRIVGFVVRTLVDEGKNFTDKKRTKELLAEKGIKISNEDYEKTLDPKKVIYQYNSQGGVAPKETARMIKEMQKTSQTYKNNLRIIKNRLQTAKNKTNKIIDLVVNKKKSVKSAVKEVLK